MPSRKVGYLVTLALAGAILPTLLLSPGCDPCPACTSKSSPSPSRTITRSRTATATPTPAPPSAFSQGLIAIDPSDGNAFVPIYALDTDGNAQIEVVNGGGALISSGADTVRPAAVVTLAATISLPGAIQPVGGVFDPVTKNIFVEARQIDSSSLSLYEINPATNTVINTIALTGLVHDGFFGGLLADPARKQLVAAGTTDLGTVDVSVSPPVFKAASVESSIANTDSIAINPNTGMLFVSGDGFNVIQPVTALAASPAPSPAPQQFMGTGATTDGVAFDPTTNIVAQTAEVGSQEVFGFNFGSLNTGVTPATAPDVLVPGLGINGALPLGEGPGGQLVVNSTTHQALVADEFGVNFWLVQMPSAAVTAGGGVLDNKGQPGSGTTADAASLFTIAGAVLPTTLIGGVPTQLCAVGDPNSLTVDPNTNTGLMLADTNCFFHTWSAGSSTPLFLILVNLASPPLGACPSCATTWSPTITPIQMP